MELNEQEFRAAKRAGAVTDEDTRARLHRSLDVILNWDDRRRFHRALDYMLDELKRRRCSGDRDFSRRRL
jgi:hypothetical protein